MKNKNKKDILQLLETLKKANRELANALPLPIKLSLLKDCHLYTLDIITTLTAEGQTPSEVLEQLSIYATTLKKLTFAPKTLNPKQLNVALNKIESLIIKSPLGANQKYKALFLPYKYAMSDSLESVWQAALQDDTFETTILPIPYFTKNTAGVAQDMIYEGHLYQVPTANWEEYNLKDEKPDIVFIHNPYDDNNTLTSVHPDYYSEHLKVHTDLLCYVPYAMNNWRVDVNASLGSLNADFIYLDQKTAAQHRELFTEGLEKLNVTPTSKQLDKFQGLGHPKYDAVINYTSIDIPETWVKKQAQNKPVIFYNTTLSSIYKNPKQFLDKLKFTLNEFSKRSDFVVLWRPHPLSESAFTNISPDLLEDYHGIVSTFIQEDLHIYDDSPYFHRAIHFSDVYFGEFVGSSFFMFAAIGKPLFIQNPQVLDSAAPTSSTEEYILSQFEAAKTTPYWEPLKFEESSPSNSLLNYFDLIQRSHQETLSLAIQSQIDGHRQHLNDGSAGIRIWEHAKNSLLND